MTKSTPASQSAMAGGEGELLGAAEMVGVVVRVSALSGWEPADATERRGSTRGKEAC